MGADRNEASRRGLPSSTKAGAKNEARQFVQIKTVVMTSDAYRASTASARCVLLELCARLKWVSGQPEPTNNGRLWLSREEWEKAGFAPATVTRSLKELVKHGLVYRARSGGIGRGCSEYAVTFYGLTKDTDGLFFQGFRKNAWANFTPEQKKHRESKLNRDRFKNDSLPPENSNKEIKTEPSKRIIFEHQESESTSLRVSDSGAGLYSAHQPRHNRPRKPATSPFCIRLNRTADRGHLRLVA